MYHNEHQLQRILCENCASPEQNNIQIINEIISQEFGGQPSNLDQWTINVIQYTATMTVSEQENCLREIKTRAKRAKKPDWKIRIESRTETIRQKLLYMYMLQDCQKADKFTGHQSLIKRKMEK